MGKYFGGKYDAFYSTTYEIGSVSDLAYTSGNVFSSDLTMPASGEIELRVTSSTNNTDLNIVVNAVSVLLINNLKTGVLTPASFSVFDAETVNFTLSKATTLTMNVYFAGITP